MTETNAFFSFEKAVAAARRSIAANLATDPKNRLGRRLLKDMDMFDVDTYNKWRQTNPPAN